MKKLITMMSLLVCVSALLFAQGASVYVVQSVTGKVEYEAAPGTWKTVTKGMELAPSAMVNTGLNSTLVVASGSSKISVKPMQKGTIEKLANAVAANKSGIKMGSNVSTSDVNAQGVTARQNVSTASSRASDADKDLSWQE